ncbi:hypothetical protein BU16DRAFT_105505 [Lophium mytilinum]|uniref:Deoxyribonuclease NucA/NucB domain-containing protein n=1 Tax=Lophium mytilinum TaxID=390894 RepID=A0A6A6QJ92_9PEZI|nr:hypothetical protein BU16DRAFT_105505 [Lophium mytilinum]
MFCHFPGTVCCPQPSEQACWEGTTCCGAELCCLEGAECFGDTVCCMPGEVACDGWCCAEGQTCSAETDFCQAPGGEKEIGMKPSQTAGSKPASAKTSKPPTSTPKISLPKESTKAPSEKVSTPRVSTPKPSTPKASTPKASTPKASTLKASTPKASTPKASTPRESIRGSATRTISSPGATSTKVSSSDESTTTSSALTTSPKRPKTSRSSTASAMPTILFPYIPVLTDDLVANMCLGLRARAAPVNQEVLHYAGPKSGNRKQTRCKDGKCCEGQTKADGPNKGYKLSCDEYPFSSAQEGGKQQNGQRAHVGCITDFQNGAQGSYLGPFYEAYKMKKGDPFLVKITGIDCDTVHEDDIPGCTRFRKRQEDLAHSQGVFYPPDDPSKTGKLIIGLGDVIAGTYHMSVSFPPNSVILNVHIIDNQGETFSVTSAPSSGSTYILSFTLSEVGYGVSLVTETTNAILKEDSYKVEFGPVNFNISTTTFGGKDASSKAASTHSSPQSETYPVTTVISGKTI